MPTRNSFSLFKLIFAAVTFYAILYLGVGLNIYHLMTDSDSSSDVPLRVRVSDVQETTEPGAEFAQLNLKVQIANISPDHPVSFVKWSTPLDSKAVIMGVFTFKSLKTGDMARCLEMKVKPKMPHEGELFDANDVIRLDPKAEIEEVVEVAAPKVELLKGEHYEVVATGRWFFVLVGDGEMRSGSDRLLSGDFKSDGFKFELKEG